MLKFRATAEGRVVRISATSNSNDIHLQTTLGNGRVYFEINASNATAKIQEIDYYGFGLEINRILPSAKNLYMYNGKEKQEHEKLFDYGLPKETLQIQAGKAQIAAGTSLPKWQQCRTTTTSTPYGGTNTNTYMLPP